MPLVIFLAIRLWRAFAATFRLLSDGRLLRMLPWSYIVRLPLRHAWIGMASASLLGTLACTILVLTLPDEPARHAAFYVGLSLAFGGIISSWLRALIAWLRLRGYHLRDSRAETGLPDPSHPHKPVTTLPADVELSSAGRRLAAQVLDVLLLIVTVFVGWFVWSLIVWGGGQTPGKQLLHIRVVYLESGARLSRPGMAFRELIGKGIILLVALGTWIGFIGFFWLLWDDKRQQIWDKMARSIVLDDPTTILA